MVVGYGIDFFVGVGIAINIYNESNVLLIVLNVVVSPFQTSITVESSK
jgi:hypothetical protein